MANIGNLAVQLSASTSGLTAGFKHAKNVIDSFSTQARTSLQKVIGATPNEMADKLRSGLSGVGNVIERSLTSPMRVLGETLSRIPKVGKALALPAIGLGVGAILFERELASVHEMGKAARKAGVDIEQMNKIATAFAPSMGLEGVSKSFAKLNQNIGSLMMGSAQAKAAFGRLGLTLKDLEGLTPDDQFRKVFTAISQLESPALQVRTAMDLMGKGAVDMLDTIQKGPGELDRIGGMIDKYGSGMSEKDLAAVEVIKQARQEFEIFRGAISGQILGAVAPMIAQFRKQFSGLGMNFSSLGDIITTVAEKISQAVTMLVAVWDPLVGSIKMADGATEILRANALTTLSMITDAVGWLVEKTEPLVDVIVDVYTSFKNAASDTMAWLIESLTEVSPAFEEVYAAGKQAFDGIVEAIAWAQEHITSWAEAWEFVGQVAGHVTGFISTSIGVLVGKIDDLVAHLGPVKDFWEGAKKAFGDWFDYVIGGLTKVAEAVAKFFSYSGKNSLGQAAKAMRDHAAKMRGDALEKIGEGANQALKGTAFEKAFEGLDKFWDGVKAPLEIIRDTSLKAKDAAVAFYDRVEELHRAQHGAAGDFAKRIADLQVLLDMRDKGLLDINEGALEVAFAEAANKFTMGLQDRDTQFANVVTQGSKEAYSAILKHQNPRKQENIQERIARAAEAAKQKHDEQVRQGREVIRLLRDGGIPVRGL